VRDRKLAGGSSACGAYWKTLFVTIESWEIVVTSLLVSLLRLVAVEDVWRIIFLVLFITCTH
jgi:hypothetical protein